MENLIYKVISDNPGMNFREIVHATGLPYVDVDECLSEMRKVVVHKVEGRSFYYPEGWVPPKQEDGDFDPYAYTGPDAAPPKKPRQRKAKDTLKPKRRSPRRKNGTTN